VCEKDRQLRMKHAGQTCDGLELILATRATRPLFTKSCANALRVCQDQRIACPTADEPIENDRLEKREAQCISREGHLPPRQRADEVERLYMSLPRLLRERFRSCRNVATRLQSRGACATDRDTLAS